MKKVRCGIVGLGQIGPMHCESVSQIENAQLVCVCDLDEEKAKKYAQMYHCDYTLSFDELIARTTSTSSTCACPAACTPNLAARPPRPAKT